MIEIITLSPSVPEVRTQTHAKAQDCKYCFLKQENLLRIQYSNFYLALVNIKTP